MRSLDYVLRLATKHIPSGSTTADSNARFCLADAIGAKERGDFESARRWAVKSLCYSVGVFHPDYKRATS